MTMKSIRKKSSWRRAAAVPALALCLAAVTPAAAQEQSWPGGFTSDQVQGIEEIVRQYLLDNPDVLVEALTIYQQRQKVAEKERQQQSVGVHRKALLEDPDAPVLGNPKGDVAIVEFFDYRCPYCRRAAENIKKVIEEDGNIRLIMKEFPILGPQSMQAARAALAAANQGKYEEFHWTLMLKPGDMSDPHIRTVAREMGLDVERLEADMKSKEIEDMIRRNRGLANALAIRGTPAFVIGNTLVPGPIDLPTLKRLVAAARARAS